jgi:hypothetical protein
LFAGLFLNQRQDEQYIPWTQLAFHSTRFAWLFIFFFEAWQPLQEADLAMAQQLAVALPNHQEDSAASNYLVFFELVQGEKD